MREIKLILEDKEYKFLNKHKQKLNLTWKQYLLNDLFKKAIDDEAQQ